MSPLSAEYRSSSKSANTTDSDSDDDDYGGRGRGLDEEGTELGGLSAGPGALTVTPALLAAFTTSLTLHKVRLRFFAGGWASLCDYLDMPSVHHHHASANPVAHPHPPPGSESEEHLRCPYDIVLASETIYRAESLDAFLAVLRAATMPGPISETRGQLPPPTPSTPTLCLVAAKVLYFGVGGGVEGFVRAVETEGGTVRTVWEHQQGVGRRIMRVEW
jgi:protein-histidine N-methyltransferase